MTDTVIDKRLESCAELVRQGAVLADVGTDHGYLPLFLLERGRIDGAVLTDVNEGPLASARLNAEGAGLSDKVRFLLTDGAVELSGMGVTDVSVCGMGGHLIIRIIENAPWLKSCDIRLILQPMTKVADLRRFLEGEGFSVMRESYSYAKGKHYVAMLAGYTGTSRTLPDADAELGILPDYSDPEYLGYLREQARILSKIIGGKQSGGQDSEYEARILYEAERRIKEMTK